MKKWESEKHTCWGLPAEGFVGHVTTNGSLPERASGEHVVGQWCSWIWRDGAFARDGSMEAEFEVKRTIKRAELTAFLCLLKRLIGPVKVHVD